MASEDINTAISVGQAIWGALVIAANLGGLWVWTKFNIKSLKETSIKQSQEIKDLNDRVQVIREKWVTEDKLDRKLQDLSVNIANAIIVKLEDRKWDGSERRNQ